MPVKTFKFKNKNSWRLVVNYWTNLLIYFFRRQRETSSNAVAGAEI